MKTIDARNLLDLPVRLHGIQLGRPADLLLDRTELRALGVDVLCGDDVHRFLPLPAATIESEELTIRSPLVLLEEDELAFYRARAFALSSLRGRPVERRGRVLGPLRDVAIAPDGTLVDVVLADADRVPFDETIRFAPGTRSAA